MRSTGNIVIAYLLVALIGAASVGFLCVYVIPRIQFLFTTVAKALSLAMGGA